MKEIEDSHKLENVQVKDKQEKEEREWAEKLERERSRTLNKVKLILELYFCSVVGFPISSHLFFKAYLVIYISCFLWQSLIQLFQAQPKTNYKEKYEHLIGE